MILDGQKPKSMHNLGYTATNFTTEFNICLLSYIKISKL